MRKLLSMLFLAVFLLTGVISSAQAQSGVHPVAAGKFDVRFTVKNLDCTVSPKTLTIAVQVKSKTMADTFLMGDANYRFRFKTTQLRLLGTSPLYASSLVSQENFSSALASPNRDFNYGIQNLNGSGEGPTAGIVSLNTFYSGSNQGGKLVTTTWTTVACIKFTVVSGPTECFDLTWNTNNDFPVTGMNEIYNLMYNPSYDYKQENVAAGGYFGNVNQCAGTYCSPILAVNDINTTPQNMPVSGQVLTNDIGSGLVVTTTPIANPLNGTVVLNANGIYTYTPASGFSGNDSFKYKICDNLTPQKCDTALVNIAVIPPVIIGQNAPPVALNDTKQTTMGIAVSGNVLSNDFDPNAGQTLTVTTTPVLPPVNGTVVLNANGTYTYTPTPGFIGLDSFMYKVCDNGSPVLCSNATVYIDVVFKNTPVTANDKPVTGDDAGTTLKNTAFTGRLNTNDSDPNAGQILAYTITPISAPAHGSVAVTPTGGYTYTPATGYTGSDAFTYNVCDNGSPSLCSMATAYITIFDIPCTTLDLKVILQGPYDQTTGLMKTTLNQRGLLPGQTPIGLYAVPTPAGQPYTGLPFSYAGTETMNSYATTVVDWVLVTLRTNQTAASKVFQVAGLLNNDGTITFINPCFNIANGSYYVVIEHRNHMGVMSPTAIAVIGGKISFDFTVAQSFQLTNPPSFGQKTIGTKFVMYAADGKKVNVNDNYDINFNDSQLWKILSGNFDVYLLSDFDMDADTNFGDDSLWKTNSGRFSGVPH
jgi:hypothetical protein